MVNGAKSKYRDKLLGLVVHLKVNGKTIKPAASNDKVLALPEETK